MNNLIFGAIILVVTVHLSVKSQPFVDPHVYDITKDKILYTIGYSHLDTEWNWDYPTTINESIRNTMTENFYLFEKYPEYVFNFTGSRRYRMMKEYYPQMYKKVIHYINEGRWFVSGSSVDEGEVIVSSSESLIRQVLYGNNYFRNEFGKESKDYMLPDCFGFLANLPTIWNHCGLLGFSTQKLTWQSASGIPFNIGVWKGPDDKGIIAALNATEYIGNVVNRLDMDSIWDKRLTLNQQKYDFSFDYRYYGVGDMGGAPRERDVKNVIGSLNNKDRKFKVVLSSSDQMFKDINTNLKKKLPTYSGDLLLTEHSAGSLTSQAFMKRINRKNEFLAQSAEQLAVFADWRKTAAYPFSKINEAWELLLGSQFHDILPGTSIPKAYEYAWNDEFIAANGFAEVLKNSITVLSNEMNTIGEGRSIIVYNPVPMNREDIVTVDLNFKDIPKYIKVIDSNGKVVPSQIVKRDGNVIKVIFLAKVPSVGLSIYIIKEAKENYTQTSSLKVSANGLENDYYKITIAQSGDIISIIDKKISKEILSKPAKLEFLSEKSTIWPAWNMHWEERQKPPIGYLNNDASINIIEQGPVRIALKINRKGYGSQITQILSLSNGEAGKRIEIDNELNWNTRGLTLKAAFPFTASNPNATYNLGVGTIQRNNNNEVKFEVPSKEWFDLTDQTGNYGISILEDCKYGSDKPDDQTLRLTLLYTPEVDKRHKVQGSQDWGIHNFKYGLYSHQGSWIEGKSPWQGKFLNQPLMAFEVSKHEGKLGKEISLISFNSTHIGLMAFKKMENSDYYLIRVNELFGKDAEHISIKFIGKVIDAFEVNGQEQKIGEIDYLNGNINFDITHYSIRSFAVKFAPSNNIIKQPSQIQIRLPFNVDAFSFDNNRHDGNFDQLLSYPAELIPEKIISEDIVFNIGNISDEQNNAVSCIGQKINIPDGDFNTLYVLASAKKSSTGEILIGDNSQIKFTIQDWCGYIGQHYNRKFGLDQFSVIDIDKPYVKTDNIAWFASHRHLAYPSKNEAYKYCYIYKYKFNLPPGTKSITLPINENIKIFAITAVKSANEDVKALQPLFDLFNPNLSGI